MSAKIKPIYLMADSQLLFWKEHDIPFLQELSAQLDFPLKASYIGASNGNIPEYYDIFTAAMETIGIEDCHFIKDFSEKNIEHLNSSSLILLSGGDTTVGWELFKQHQLQDILARQYLNGCVIVGISAGAVQLGLKGWQIKNNRIDSYPTFQLVPYVISVHESGDWPQLNKVVNGDENQRPGIGIPSGGGAIIYPDFTVQPVRNPLIEISTQKESAFLYPAPDSHASLDETIGRVEKTEPFLTHEIQASSEQIH